jgi:hypothetical protein
LWRAFCDFRLDISIVQKDFIQRQKWQQNNESNNFGLFLIHFKAESFLGLNRFSKSNLSENHTSLIKATTLKVATAFYCRFSRRLLLGRIQICKQILLNFNGKNEL